ncbi:MAG: IS66 family insertion sequence element accessory protein TnpB [Maribacter sp.]|nr:IS66 family insertion sequence element accessory protein TnpB [Maribacter sp.]
MKKSERADHISYWRQSGQTKKAYCDLAGIRYATFISWFKNQEVDKLGHFVKLEKSDQSKGLEIMFTNGIRLYCDEALTIDLLKALQSV